MTNPFNKLLGAQIVNLAVERTYQYGLRFVTLQGDKYIGVESDCCSETWFADIIGVKNLLDEVVSGVEELGVSAAKDDRSRQDFDKCYGVRLKTRKGDCDIIYRNSSNGYYGGEAVDMTHGKGLTIDWELITDDWQANQLNEG